MKYIEIKKIVFEAVAGSVGIAEGIKRYIENTVHGEIGRNDFDAVLHTMQTDGEITLLNNGAFSAFFPGDRKPSGFYRAGDGKVKAFYEQSSHGMPIVVVEPDNDFDAYYEDETHIVITPHFSASDLERIETLVAEGFTNKEIAGQMDISERLFSNRARNHLPTRQAISDGHKKRKLGTQIAAADETIASVEPPTVDAPHKPKQRVVDVRPAARLVITEFSDAGDTEPFPRRKSLSPEKSKRLCLCGNPLGARANECKTCWLELKSKITPRSGQKTDPATDRKIKEVLANTDFDREKLSEIAIEVFLEFAPPKVKEKFAERLWQELMDATENAEISK